MVLARSLSDRPRDGVLTHHHQSAGSAGRRQLGLHAAQADGRAEQLQLGRQRDLLEIIEARGWRPRWFEAAAHVLRGDLAAAAEACRAIGSNPEEAEARLRAAEEMRPDDPDRAEHARRALDLSHRMNATALVRRAELLTPRSA